MPTARLEIDEQIASGDSSKTQTMTKLPDDGHPDDGDELDGVEEGTIDERWTPTWSDDKDEWCRAHIFNRMCSPEVDGKILVENMDLCYKWIRRGDVPEKPKSKLQVHRTDTK